MAPTRRGRRLLLRPHRLALDALRQPGGAGGVEHRRRADRRVGQRLMRLTPKIPIGHAVGHAGGGRRHAIGRGDLRWRRHDQELDPRRQPVVDLRQQIGVADQRVGAAVGQDVGDLVGLQMPVDRHHRTAERSGGCDHFEQREIVAQHHADRLAALHAERAEAGGRPCDAGVNVAIADLSVAADDHTGSLQAGRPGIRRWPAGNRCAPRCTPPSAAPPVRRPAGRP